MLQKLKSKKWLTVIAVAVIILVNRLLLGNTLGAPVEQKLILTGLGYAGIEAVVDVFRAIFPTEES